MNHVHMDDGLRAFLTVCPMVFVQILFLGNAYTAVQIFHAKSVGVFNPLPFHSMVVDCTVWSLYGLMIHDLALLSNVSGAALGIVGSVVVSR